MPLHVFTRAEILRGARAGGAARRENSWSDVEREDIARRGRNWWAQFTPEERSAIVRKRLKGRFPGRPKGWTLDLPADHPGLLSMRANGMKCADAMLAKQRAGRILRRLQALDLQEQGIPEREIAARVGVRLDTLRSYFKN